MPDALTNSQRDELIDLVEKSLVGEATPAELERIEALVTTSSETARLYNQIILDSMHLRDWALSEVPANLQEPITPMPLPAIRKRRVGAWAMVLSHVAVAAAAILLWRAIETDKAIPKQKTVPLPLALNPTESPPNEQVDFGVPQVLIKDHFGDQFIRNQDLPNGQYRLAKGLVQLQYSTGTEAVIQAPAEFAIDGTNRIRLERGTARVTVPLNAVGFQVVTPLVTITDLSTEFGVHARDDGATFVTTFIGLVEVTDAQGNATRLPGQSSQWFGNSESPKEAAQFPTAHAIRAANRLARRDHLRSAFDVVAHYDFSLRDGSLPNLVDPEHGTGMIRGGDEVPGRLADGTALRFGQAEDQVEVQIDQQLENFTVAAWIKLDKFSSDYATIINATGWEPGDIHFQITKKGEINLGICQANPYREEPQRFNWLSPPGIVPVGEWCHVAVVANALEKTVTHYLNGYAVSRRHAPGVAAQRFGKAAIGRWLDHQQHQDARPFLGSIDELIIFGEALTPADLALLAAE